MAAAKCNQLTTERRLVETRIGIVPSAAAIWTGGASAMKVRSALSCARRIMLSQLGLGTLRLRGRQDFPSRVEVHREYPEPNHYIRPD